jgi:hypothetical protein
MLCVILYLCEYKSILNENVSIACSLVKWFTLLWAIYVTRERNNDKDQLVKPLYVITSTEYYENYHITWKHNVLIWKVEAACYTNYSIKNLSFCEASNVYLVLYVSLMYNVKNAYRIWSVGLKATWKTLA